MALFAGRQRVGFDETCPPSPAADVYYGDIHAGTIAIRTSNPHDENPRA
jgi:hypothetical protein